MRTRTLAILLVVLGILAGVGTLMIREKGPERSPSLNSCPPMRLPQLP